MKVGLIPINVGHTNVEAMTKIAQKAEEVGVDRLIIPVQALGGPPLEALDKLGNEFLSKMS